jgi:CheY-like chemotaxis protein
MEAIGTLAGGIAHDFNNILTGLLGYTELAKMQLPQAAKAHKSLEEVLKAGHRASELVQQILAFSRQRSEDRKPVQIVPIVKEAVPTGQKQILFVDDEVPLVNLGRQILESLGYRVEPRTSPIEALAAFRANPDKFDLVITDKTMPFMTGFDLAREIREIRQEIPIILCTGFGESADMRRAEALGINETLMKPLVLGDLARIIRQVLDG